MLGTLQSTWNLMEPDAPTRKCSKPWTSNPKKHIERFRVDWWEGSCRLSTPPTRQATRSPAPSGRRQARSPGRRRLALGGGAASAKRAGPGGGGAAGGAPWREKSSKRQRRRVFCFSRVLNHVFFVLRFFQQTGCLLYSLVYGSKKHVLRLANRVLPFRLNGMERLLAVGVEILLEVPGGCCVVKRGKFPGNFQGSVFFGVACLFLFSSP